MEESTKNLLRTIGNEISGKNSTKRDLQQRIKYLKKLETMSYLELSARYSRLEQKYKAGRWYGIVALVLVIIWWNMGLKHLLIQYIVNAAKLDGSANIKISVVETQKVTICSIQLMFFLYLIALMFSYICIHMRSDFKAKLKMIKQIRDLKANDERE